MGRNLIARVSKTCDNRQADSGKIKPGSETVKNPDPDSFRPQNQRSRTQNPKQTRPQPPVERGWADKADSRPPLRGPGQYCSARILPSGAFRRNLKKLSKSMIIPLARSLHLAHLITSQHGPRQGRTQFDSVIPRCPENEGQRSTLTLAKLSDELKLPLPLPI